jgi:UPF0716 protein FxsA
VLPSLRLAFLLIFVAFPLIEIAVLIKAGEMIGFWPTIGLLIMAATLGVLVIRHQGLTMLNRMLAAASEGKLPLAPMLDGYALVMAGALLIVPGLVSSVIGLLLLVPPVRVLAIRSALSGLTGGAAGDRSSGSRKSAGPTVIDATYERIDEDTDDHKSGGSGRRN